MCEIEEGISLCQIDSAALNSNHWPQDEKLLKTVESFDFFTTRLYSSRSPNQSLSFIIT